LDGYVEFAAKINKWLSYRREIALQGGLVLAESGTGRRYFAETIGLSLTTVT